MRNKFSEWVDAGIARFEYTPILPEVSQNDPICMQYNNIFSMALDTHMSLLEDGRRIITGHNVATQKWRYFVNCSQWGGMNFADAGYWSVNDFLSRFNLGGKESVINGDIVWLVEEYGRPQDTEMPKVANESVEESPSLFYVVNTETNKSYLVASNNVDEALQLTSESNKECLKAMKLNLSVPSSTGFILADSDQIING